MLRELILHSCPVAALAEKDPKGVEERALVVCKVKRVWKFPQCFIVVVDSSNEEARGLDAISVRRGGGGQ
jgi:hypothetical protein